MTVKPSLVISAKICIKEKPNSKAKMVSIIDSYPAILIIEHTLELSHGRVPLIVVRNAENGKRIDLKPFQIDNALQVIEYEVISE